MAEEHLSRAPSVVVGDRRRGRPQAMISRNTSAGPIPTAGAVLYLGDESGRGEVRGRVAERSQLPALMPTSRLRNTSSPRPWFPSQRHPGAASARVAQHPSASSTTGTARNGRLEMATSRSMAVVAQSAASGDDHDQVEATRLQSQVCTARASGRLLGDRQTVLSFSRCVGEARQLHYRRRANARRTETVGEPSDVPRTHRPGDRHARRRAAVDLYSSGASTGRRCRPGESRRTPAYKLGANRRLTCSGNQSPRDPRAENCDEVEHVNRTRPSRPVRERQRNERASDRSGIS